MPSLSSFFLLAAQAPRPQPPGNAKIWLYILTEPSFTFPGTVGALLTWIKVVGLFCLLGWVGSWLITAIKERAVPAWLTILALIGVIGSVAAVLLSVMQESNRFSSCAVGGVDLVEALLWGFRGAILLWAVWAFGAGVFRKGKSADRAVLLGLFAATALGFSLGFLLQDIPKFLFGGPVSSNPVNVGARLAATLMGYVALIRVAVLLFVEVVAVRPRRLYSIAWQTWTEAVRRMWAPWVVIAVFAVILAFTHWFLGGHRENEAEIGRSYVITLALLSSTLLMAMVGILSPISLPQDIQAQTVYTIVSKPIRRVEMIWGRMIGYLALVTALVLLLGAISLLYLERMVGGAIRETETAAVKARQAGRLERAAQLDNQVAQMRARKSARERIRGSLMFIDSRGKKLIKGIDVGSEMELRSYVEGATQSKAIWSFGILQNPRKPQEILELPVDVGRLLRPNTIEAVANRSAELQIELAEKEARRRDEGRLKADDASSKGPEFSALRHDVELTNRELEALVNQEREYVVKAEEAEAAGKTTEAQGLRERATELHTSQIPLEMTFNVYRTTKGVLGEPVSASMRVSNSNPKMQAVPSLLVEPYRDIFRVHEYYTNKQYFPAMLLVGCQGYLTIEIQCVSPNQYLGMAESDLYILSHQGRFEINYLKGLLGIWLQAMVLTAVGVCVGSFLSWPVALLATFFFFGVGQFSFDSLRDFSLNVPLGGGPFEATIRLISHENINSELSPTLAVVTARALDSIVMPVLSRLVFIVPNFSALDVTNTVADGYAVSTAEMMGHILLGLAYALPFSVAGYFILKNREVAA